MQHTQKSLALQLLLFIVRLIFSNNNYHHNVIIHMRKKIAIIGAGISGLTLANNLKNIAEVTVFEKARGVGGRMSTRYALPFYFDHGTQFFTARSKAFQAFIAGLIDLGIVAEWTGKVITIQANNVIKDRLWFEPHYVASPNMNDLCKYMASEINVVLSTEIAPLGEKQHDGWRIFSKATIEKNGVAKEAEMLGVFDWVISTAPPAQTLNLFNVELNSSSTLLPMLNSVEMQGCYTLMLGFNEPWRKPWIAAKIHNDIADNSPIDAKQLEKPLEKPLEWIAINSTKPSRNANVTAIVAHSRNDWAEEHIDDDMQQAQNCLVNHFEQLTGISCGKADYISTHRWKYALITQPNKLGSYVDNERNIAATGDWTAASRIEEVWLEAMKLSADIKLEIEG